MIESYIGAGLVNGKTDKYLFFALEPEASSLYCSINKEIDRNHLNNYFIINFIIFWNSYFMNN